MIHLDLFSGTGGFAYGLKKVGFKTVGFCEINKKCRIQLRGEYPNAFIHDDIRTFNANMLDRKIDIITGGYPCQPFSSIGTRIGKAHPSYLWPEMLRIIQFIRPRWIICENADEHFYNGYDEVAAQLGNEGYTIWTFMLPATAIGAPHIRERLWFVAHANSERCDQKEIWLQEQRQTQAINAIERLCSYWKETKPPILGMDDGVPDRSHRIAAMGNSIMPAIAAIFGATIKQFEEIVK